MLTALLPAESLHATLAIRAVLAAVFALGATLITGPALIAALRRQKIGEQGEKGDSAELDRLHSSKRGTPTMGGLLIVSSSLVSSIVFADLAQAWVLVFLVATLVLAAIGGVDDLAKLTSGGRGMRSRVKLALLTVVALAVGGFGYAQRVATSPLPTAEAAIDVGGGANATGDAAAAAADSADGRDSREASRAGALADATAIAIPLTHQSIPLGLGYVLFAALVVVATTNAVNFTDGIDGLCAGTATIALTTYAAITLALGSVALCGVLGTVPLGPAREVAVCGAALSGATLGFLWFNAYPARVFMGDTGSLAVGGGIAILAIACRQELLLLIVGGVFVLEGLSVVLQVLSFKLTGRRIFRIAPIHHHYQFGGLTETQVTQRFWILGAIFALLALTACFGLGGR